MNRPLSRDPSTPQLALIADHSPDAESAYRRLLVPRRFIVDHSTNGADALAKAIREVPDVIIVHAALPVINGMELRAIIRRDPGTRHIPVIVITDEPKAAEALASGLDSTAALPWDAVEQALLSTINALSTQQPRSTAASEPDASKSQKAPPALRCPSCDGLLRFERSHFGGVRKLSEQWDAFTCERGCGRYEYRHRTRTCRKLAEA